MVNFQEYLVQVGDRRKRVGIVGEEHGFCNKRESALASELVDKYSTLAVEGTAEKENYPLYEMLVDFVFSYFVYPFTKIAMGGHKCFDHYILERGRSFVYLERDRSSYFSQADKSYKIDQLKSIIRAPFTIPIAIHYGIMRRRTPVVEKPERPKDFSPETGERSTEMVQRFLEEVLENPDIEDSLVLLGKDHFLNFIDELGKQVELTRIS